MEVVWLSKIFLYKHSWWEGGGVAVLRLNVIRCSLNILKSYRVTLYLLVDVFTNAIPC